MFLQSTHGYFVCLLDCIVCQTRAAPDSPLNAYTTLCRADATLSAWSDKSASKKFDLPNDERRPVRTLHCWGEGRMLCGGADNGSILLWNLRSRLTTQRFMNAFNVSCCPSSQM